MLVVFVVVDCCVGAVCRVFWVVFVRLNYTSKDCTYEQTLPLGHLSRIDCLRYNLVLSSHLEF